MKLLIVDDADLNRKHYELMMRGEGEWEIISFPSGEMALEWCSAGGAPDMIIADYVLPGMNGLDVLREMRKLPTTKDVPALMISAIDDKAVRQGAFALGAIDFVTQPVDHHELPLRIKNMMLLRERHMAEAATADWLANQVKKATADLLERERKIIYRLARLAEYRDPETKVHPVRVGHFSRLIGEELSIKAHTLESLFTVSPLHDVGKVAIPDYILLKTGELTQAEFDIMKTHTTVGYELLVDEASSLLNMAATIALTHHERFDGKGYPRGLKDEAIPLVGRICALADTFDVLTMPRPYKPRWDNAKALREIERCSGTQFDPRVVDAFKSVLPEILRLKAQYPDEEPASSKTVQISRKK